MTRPIESKNLAGADFSLADARAIKRVHLSGRAPVKGRRTFSAPEFFAISWAAISVVVNYNDREG